MTVPTGDTEADKKLDWILSELHYLADEYGERWNSAVRVSSSLLERHGIRIHWRTIDAILANGTIYVARRKRQRRWEYSLLAPALNRIGAFSQIILIDPTKSIQATKTLHGLLGELRGTIRICDPYLDGTTIEQLDACCKGAQIRFLTQNIRDGGQLRRLLAAAGTAGYRLEIRVPSERVLHDRYIMDDSKMFILGTSLNGFGKKQSFVVRTGDDFRRAMAADFDSRWSASAPWPPT